MTTNQTRASILYEKWFQEVPEEEIIAVLEQAEKRGAERMIEKLKKTLWPRPESNINQEFSGRYLWDLLNALPVEDKK